MYIFMFAYVYLVGCLWKKVISIKGITTKYNNKVTFIGAIIILAVPVFFIGMRTSYVDTEAYIFSFKMLPTDWNVVSVSMEDSKGVLWLFYEWIIKKYISSDASVFLLITAVIQAGAILKFYYKHSVDYGYSVLLFFLSCSFLNMMNGIRQFLAVAIILYFADWIFEKQYWKFIVVVLIASFIHVSAIVWIPAVFVIQGKPWNAKTLIFSIIILLSILFVDRFTDILEETLLTTAYAGYTDQFEHDDGSNLMHTIIAMLPVLIAFVGRRVLAIEQNKKINVMINISIFGTMLSLLANFTSGILIGRMPIYFTLFSYALLPSLFQEVFTARSVRYVRVLCAFGYAMYAIYYMYVVWTPYISSVLGIYIWR